LELDPDVFEAYTQFSAVPFRHLGSDGEGEGEEPAGRASGAGTGLSPKVKGVCVHCDRLCNDVSVCAGLEVAHSECGEVMEVLNWRV
jgi:hypothetical protein